MEFISIAIEENLRDSLFGTDGIRGRTNFYPIDAETLLKIGISAGNVIGNNLEKPKVIIGKDTRRSGYMVENALTAGFISAGWDVNLLGPLPTPAVSFLTKSLRADLGIMISASHNPFEDNGIKFFDRDGFKLDDELEALISNEVKRPQALVQPQNLGRASRINDVLGRYTEFAKTTVSGDLRLDGLKVLVDCANGAAYKLIPQTISELGAEVIPVNVDPNGFNINLECGSTYPRRAQEAVLAEKADLGLCLDGDADRVLLIDENGKIADGDQVMALIAKSWMTEGSLRNNTLVATVMSNLAFEIFLKDIGVQLIRTNVGDRHVAERMLAGGFNLGGEQSGHIILSDFSSTGDGLITSLQILSILKASNKRASELLNSFEPFPQRIVNLDPKSCNDFLSNDRVKKELLNIESRIKKSGRIIIRKSGTENLIRLMVEHKDQNRLEETLNSCLGLLRK